MPGQFSSTLRRLRSQRGLSLRQFAQIVHYSPGWLSRIERGQAAPTLALARSCDDALSAEGELLKLARLEAQSQLRPAQLPSAVAGFVGRTHALGELDAAIAKAEHTGTALTVAIDGPPGAGKSALTIQWAHRVAGRFPGGVLFADLQGHSHHGRPAEPLQVLEDFLAALGTESVPDELEARSALFRTVVSDRHVLVVLDNAIDSQQVKPLLVGSASCAVLVTSRRRLTGLGITAGARRLSLARWVPRSRSNCSAVSSERSGWMPRRTWPGRWRSGARISRWLCGSQRSAWRRIPAGRCPMWPTSCPARTGLTSWLTATTTTWPCARCSTCPTKRWTGRQRGCSGCWACTQGRPSARPPRRP
ncbi:MAG: helix-turn-helix domain-containing protein [Streptomyces sp.]|nr:helix-turn-helix domain-containing protein [Streptomyces sp.]